MKRGREQFNKYKKLINIIVYVYSIFGKRVQNSLLVFHRNTKGYIGLVIRYALVKTLAASVGDNVSIHPGVYLFHVENLRIGNNVSIHPMTYMDCSGGVTIGNDVSIAHGVTCMSTTHKFSMTDVPIKDQGVDVCPIHIQNNVWIGAKAVILGGNIIGEGAVVGAGAVVTKNVIKNSVVGGVPAKLLKMRGNV